VVFALRSYRSDGGSIPLTGSLLENSNEYKLGWKP
jgi:hypothetical protein